MKLKDIYQFFVNDYKNLKGSRLFTHALYVFVFLKCIYWLINFSPLISSNSVFFHNKLSIGTLNDLAFLLCTYESNTLNILSVLALIITVISAFFLKKKYLLLDFFIWFLVLNIHNYTYASLTGGDYILNQLLFFNIFIISKNNISNSKINAIKILLHNLSVLSCMVLICIVYLYSGLSKLMQEDWYSGKAIYYIIQVKHYSLPILNNLKFTWLINYLILFFQITFCIGVLFSKTRVYYLITGIIFHLSILIGMGIVSFSVSMLIVYILYWCLKEK